MGEYRALATGLYKPYDHRQTLWPGRRRAEVGHAAQHAQDGGQFGAQRSSRGRARGTLERSNRAKAGARVKQVFDQLGDGSLMAYALPA